MKGKGSLEYHGSIKFLILIIILGCIGVPIIINIILSNDLIPSVGTNNSDWLSFWGSFLGGIVGGVATLVGVMLTLKSFSVDKKAQEESEKPKIIPLEIMNFLYYNDSSMFLTEYTQDISKKISNTDVYIDFVNIGKNHALNCKIKYCTPSYSEIEKYISNKDSIENTIMKDNCRKEIIFDAVPLIVSSLSGKTKKVKLASELVQFFSNYYGLVFKGNEERIFDKEFIIGEISINYNDIYGHNIVDIYNVYACISGEKRELKVFNGIYTRRVMIFKFEKK